jgi:hypothetical protein
VLTSNCLHRLELERLSEERKEAGAGAGADADAGTGAGAAMSGAAAPAVIVRDEAFLVRQFALERRVQLNGKCCALCVALSFQLTVMLLRCVLRCAALCCVVLRCAALCCVVLRCAALWCVVWRRVACGAASVEAVCESPPPRTRITVRVMCSLTVPL